MTALTHCLDVIGVITLHRLTSTAVLPEVSDSQHYYSTVAALTIVSETKA